MSYVVGVRALCEFTARRGDLDLRFSPAPSAQQGTEGHAAVAARRGPGYQTERALTAEYRNLRVRGRADGWDAGANLLEEIKTHRGDAARIPVAQRELHRAQAMVYGWLLCRELSLPQLRLAVVYFDVSSRTETRFDETVAAHDLQRFFEAQCAAFIEHADRELAHAAQRDASLAALSFPHEGFRAGQRQLAEAVYRAALHGRCLAAQAPTGIGKTVGTLFPLLKAWPGQAFDKIFFLTAKGSGRRLALDALRLIGRQHPAPRLRVVDFSARDDACEHPDKACHGDSCPLARGFYDRLPGARRAALEAAHILDRAALRDIALEHAICPYHLGQELLRWADVVVGDYNHWFDTSAIFFGLTQVHEWKVAVLVDEAHNLLERARRMYSATLDRDALRRARRAAPPAVARALGRLGRQWALLQADQTEPLRVHAAVDPGLTTALQRASGALSDHLAEAPPLVDDALLDLHFEVLHFLRLLESFGPHSMFDVTLQRGSDGRAGSVLSLRNIVPAPHLERRFAAARTSVLFSATLAPHEFHRDTLGLPDDAAWIDVESPFAPDQLAIKVARHVSTRYRDRAASLEPIADLIATQFEEAPGNYLAFFSSFDYLDEVAERFAARHPRLPAWRQARAMAAPDREAFLARFDEDGAGIGFAVLGGSFAEGIDLPGRRLIGAFVATLGLPPPGPVQAETQRRMQAEFGDGYGYACLYPGIQKVVQAVGRVIRSETDRGVVHLIDDRFGRADVRRLFPRWWNVELAGRSRRPSCAPP